MEIEKLKNTKQILQKIGYLLEINKTNIGYSTLDAYIDVEKSFSLYLCNKVSLTYVRTKVSTFERIIENDNSGISYPEHILKHHYGKLCSFFLTGVTMVRYVLNARLETMITLMNEIIKLHNNIPSITQMSQVFDRIKNLMNIFYKYINDIQGNKLDLIRVWNIPTTIRNLLKTLYFSPCNVSSTHDKTYFTNTIYSWISEQITLISTFISDEVSSDTYMLNEKNVVTYNNYIDNMITQTTLIERDIYIIGIVLLQCICIFIYSWVSESIKLKRFCTRRCGFDRRIQSIKYSKFKF